MTGGRQTMDLLTLVHRINSLHYKGLFISNNSVAERINSLFQGVGNEPVPGCSNGRVGFFNKFLSQSEHMAGKPTLGVSGCWTSPYGPWHGMPPRRALQHSHVRRRRRLKMNGKESTRPKKRTDVLRIAQHRISTRVAVFT